MQIEDDGHTNLLTSAIANRRFAQKLCKKICTCKANASDASGQSPDRSGLCPDASPEVMFPLFARAKPRFAKRFAHARSITNLQFVVLGDVCRRIAKLCKQFNVNVNG